MQRIRRNIIIIIILTLISLIILNISWWMITYSSTRHFTNQDYFESDVKSPDSVLGINIHPFFLIILNIIIVFISAISVAKILLEHKDHYPQVYDTCYNNSFRIEDKILDSKALINQNIDSENIEKLKEIDLTVINEDYLKRVDSFEWLNKDEKWFFLNEMLALTPQEREQILQRMEKRSLQRTYEELE